MPPAVAAVAAVGSAVAGAAAAAGGALASAAGFASFGALATSVVTNVVVGVGLSYAMQAIAGKPKQPEIPDLSSNAYERTRIVRSNIANRKIVYGEVPISGPLVFAETTDKGATVDAYLHLVIALCEGPVNNITTVWLNDTSIGTGARDGSGNVTSGDYADYARIQTKLGESGQASNIDLTSEVSNWTSAHRLRGIAYLYVRLEWNEEVYSNGIPNIKALVQGRKLYDPRTGSASYSTNPALALYDYITASYGLNASSDEVDTTSFNAAANTCEESVSLAGGGSESRYTANGVVDLGRKPIEIAEEIMTSCGGIVTYEQGTYKFFVAGTTSSSFDLTDDNLRDAIRVRTKPNRRDLFNAVRGVYVNPDDDYQPADFPIRTNSTYETQDGEQIVRDIQLPFTLSNTMAQRIAEIILQRSRQGITVEFPANFSALPISVWDVVTITNTSLGWSSKEFRVLNWRLAEAGGVDMTLQEEADVYSWTPGTDEIDYDPAPDTNLPSAFSINAPASIALSDSIVSLNNGEIVTQLEITLGASPHAFASKYEVQYKKASSNTWINGGYGSQLDYAIVGVEDGVQYDARARAISVRQIKSDWISASRTIVGKTAPPSDVSNFTINIVREQAFFTWDAVTDIDLSHYRLRWSPKTSGASYEDAIDLVPKIAKPATSITTAALTGTFFIKAVDQSGYSSDTAAETGAIIESIKDLNVIETETEHPAFAGTHTNTTEVDGTLILDTSTLFDSGSGNFDDALGLFDGGEGTVQSSGNYVFENYVDLTAKYTSRVTANIEVTALDYSDSFDATAGNFDDREGLFDGDGGTAVQTNAKLQISVTDDDPSGSPSWGDWRDFVVGDYVARALRFRVVLTSANGDQTPRVEALSVTVDMPDRIASDEDIVSGAGSKAITYSPAFKASPAVGITGQNLAQGDYWEITSKSNTGFTITFYDSGASPVSRTFDWTAKGYGELAS